MLAALLAGCDESMLDSASRSARVPRDAVADVVTRVTDGDTINLAGLGKVRLIGVDTPEVYGGVECYGREASEFVKTLLLSGRRVYYELGVDERDRYDRALAYVWLADGRFLNRLLVARGFAQPLTVPPNVEFADLFARVARRARRAARGLWSAGACSV